MARVNLPRLADRDDLTIIARLVLYSVVVLLAALVLGLCVRAFLWAAFG